MTLKSDLSKTDIDVLNSLGVGDPVEAFNERGVIHWRGTIETSAPDLGIAWIFTDTGERKLLDIQEYSIRRCPDPAMGDIYQ